MKIDCNLTNAQIQRQHFKGSRVLHIILYIIFGFKADCRLFCLFLAIISIELIDCCCV